MRWFEVAAVAIGILIAFLMVGSVIRAILGFVIDVVIAAAVVGDIMAPSRWHGRASRSRAPKLTARSASPTTSASTTCRCRGPTSNPSATRPGWTWRTTWPG